MGKQNKYRIRKIIKPCDVYLALKELNITRFTKSWRDETSEYGIICKKLGRKNNEENRCRVRYIIAKGTNDTKAKKNKNQVNESSSESENDDRCKFQGNLETGQKKIVSH